MTLAYLFKKQGPYNQLDLGVYWFKNPFVLGLWYRGIPPFNSQRGDALFFWWDTKPRTSISVTVMMLPFPTSSARPLVHMKYP